MERSTWQQLAEAAREAGRRADRAIDRMEPDLLREALAERARALADLVAEAARVPADEAGAAREALAELAEATTRLQARCIARRDAAGSELDGIVERGRAARAYARGAAM